MVPHRDVTLQTMDAWMMDGRRGEGDQILCHYLNFRAREHWDNSSVLNLTRLWEQLCSLDFQPPWLELWTTRDIMSCFPFSKKKMQLFPINFTMRTLLILLLFPDILYTHKFNIYMCKYTYKTWHLSPDEWVRKRKEKKYWCLLKMFIKNYSWREEFSKQKQHDMTRPSLSYTIQTLLDS